MQGNTYVSSRGNKRGKRDEVREIRGGRLKADCTGPVGCTKSLDCIAGEMENYWKLRERSNMNQRIFQTTVAAALRTDFRGTRVEQSTEEAIVFLEV